jgi:Protein of unknown function (DUF2917)
MEHGFDSAATAIRTLQTRFRHRKSAWRRGESRPTPDAGSTRRTLAAGETYAVEGVGTFVVHCASGSLWVTSPTLGCDLILSAGERLEVPTRGKLLVAAMADSAMWLPPGHRLDDDGGQPATRRAARRPQ